MYRLFVLKTRNHFVNFIFLLSVHKGRRRPRTCRDFVCAFGGICQMINSHPRCTCHHVACTGDEQRLMDICASDGHTYKSKCAIKRQQCIKQYEIGLIYPGVCTGKRLGNERVLFCDILFNFE